ncbi:MAG: PQ-loop domain-containing transporter [Gammaproteobacteria bacterium]|jgi:MtN3 and saliva related transmembrane protein
MNILIDIIQTVFELGLFINAILFIPQSIKILRNKSVQGLSLTTFLGFWLIQLFIVLHACIIHDYLLLTGYIFSLITCGSVVLLIIIFRKKNKNNTANEL